MNINPSSSAQLLFELKLIWIHKREFYEVFTQTLNHKCDWRSSFKQSKTGLNSEISFF